MPYQTEGPTPTPRGVLPTEIPINPIIEDSNWGDIANVVVVLLATVTAVLIIVVINRRFHRKPQAPPSDGSQEVV
jgi:hypothetical protein